MRKLRSLFICFALVALGLIALVGCGSSKDYSHLNYIFVSPDGDANADGQSEKNPTVFGVALIKATPGTTILMEEGVYEYNSRIKIENNGAPNKYITVQPKNAGDEVIFDFSEMFFDSNARGIQLYGDFWHFKDIQVTGAGDNGMYISGSYNIIERCLFYNNRDSGLQIGRGASADISINTWPSFNLIKNCTSFANYDDETFGENADGFACKLTSGYGNIFDGCVAFRNSDDGWDLYAKEDSGNIGTVILYNCVSFENGYLPYQIERVNDLDQSTYLSYNTMNGDGIGFKLGGSTMEGDVILENCVAFNNKLHGFGDNSNPGVIDIRNCTAFNNCISLDEEGNVGLRGSEGGKSNNFDLARGSSGISKSYNNYYGLLSYVNNQNEFVADEGNEDDVEMTYNTDKFRGTAAYSIFNTSYSTNNKTENYVAFTAHEDASVYASKSNDITFSAGTPYTGLSDAIFANLTPYNTKCASVEDLKSLISYHTSLRNSDGSVNLGDFLKVVDPTLLTYCEGNQIGANLSKASDSEYTHYTMPDYSACTTKEQVQMAAAYSVLEVLTNQKSVYQDFEIPKIINGCDITWVSSNPAIVSVEADEKIAVSDAVFSEIKIYTPQQDTEVKLTATMTCGPEKQTKEFNLLVKARAQSMGGITLDGATSIKVEKFATAPEPRVYALDDSAIGTRELPLSLYDLSYSYSYAQSKADSFYPVECIESSVPGVYKVTVTATSKIATDVDNKGKPITRALSYYVYILDKDCTIDFMIDGETELPQSTITLTAKGYAVGGNLSNLYGDMYSIYSKTELNVNAYDIINSEKAQVLPVEYDSISLEFSAGELTGQEFYAYYVIANKNKTFVTNVYSFSTNVIEVTNEADFNTLASTGKLGSGASSTTIYKLTKDLDYSNTKWNVPDSDTYGSFSGLFNGDGHKIENIKIEESSKNANISLFYKVYNGSVINTNFNNITLKNLNSTDGKIVGIIGRLQGGYLHNIQMTNVTARGSERVGALVGQCIGGYNYVTNCSLVNDETCTLSSAKKYTSGIIGEVEIESTVEDKNILVDVSNTFVKANLGDGKDSGGCHGGIIGRIKDAYDTFTTKITNCYYSGTITTFGNYNGGMIGDISNGNGTYYINGCYSDAAYVYKGTSLNAYEVNLLEEVQKYAHKNCNPIVGRATQVANVGFYYSEDNLGTWTEYYSSQIHSKSIVFDLTSVDDETQQIIRFEISKDYLKNIGFDLENVWAFDEETKTLSFK